MIQILAAPSSFPVNNPSTPWSPPHLHDLDSSRRMGKVSSATPVHHRQPLTVQDQNRQPLSSDLGDEDLHLPFADAAGVLHTSNFTSLCRLVENTTVNVVGVVAVFKEVTRCTRGARDFTSSITLCDPSRRCSGTGLLCFFFSDRMENLPQPIETGEILIAYNLRIKAHNHDIQAWSTHQTKFKLIGPGYHLKSLQRDEMRIVNELRDWWKTMGGAPGAKGEIIRRDSSGIVINEDGPFKSKKEKIIGELQPNTFSDIICEVVKTYPSDPYAVYVTDYSQNTALHAYAWSPVHNDWKGPYGKYTLKIECWDDAAEHAKICKVGDYYVFKNVKARMNREGKLEGSLNTDQRFPQKRMIDRLDMSIPAVKSVLKRKREYLVRLDATIKLHGEKEAEARKRAREEYPSDDETHQQPKSKHQKLQQKCSQQTSRQRKKHAKRKSVEEEIISPKLSSNVLSDFTDKQPVTIAQIVTTNLASFKPRKMRLECRVDSYHPSSIADFAVAWCELCNSTWRIGSSPLCPRCNVPPSSDTGDTPYKWEFMFLLEDAQGDTLPVIVADEDAEDLLQLQADNLHENQQLLKQLRQKLTLLLGPLEEGMSSPPKSIRKQTKRTPTKKTPRSVRFSDDISYDDDSSSSLDARYPRYEDEDGPDGGKIVRPKEIAGGLSKAELRTGVWFHACIKEFWVRESEAAFGVKRWRLFGTRIE